MENRNRVSYFIIGGISFVLLFVLIVIMLYSPYYKGFEAGLNYLTPDLSENRVILRESIDLEKSSVIKLVFEEKNSRISYSPSELHSFLRDLEIQVWNESEFFYFDYNDISINRVSGELEVIKIGELESAGNYNIYIESNLGSNPSYKIGVGFGRESRLHLLRLNSRKFY